MDSNISKWKWDASHNERCKALLSTPFWSDFTLVLGNEQSRVKVNKIFLQSASRVLNEAITKSNSSEIVIENVDTRIFEMLLLFMYTGESGVTLKDAIDLMGIATDYEVWELKEQCASILSQSITRDNVLTLLQGAVHCGHTDLMKSSLDYICENAMDILKQKEFSSLRLECLIQIIQQDRLAVDTEMDVFNAVLRWGEAECVRQNLDPAENKDMREVLNKALKFIRFPLMDATEFALNVATKSLLQTEESMALLTSFLIPPEKRSKLGSDGRFSSTRRTYKSNMAFKSDIILRRCQGAFSLGDSSSRSETIEVMANESCRIKKIIFPKEIFGGYGYNIQYLDFDAVQVQLRTLDSVQFVDWNTTSPIYHTYPVHVNPNDQNELVLDLEASPIKLQKFCWINIQVTFMGSLIFFSSNRHVPMEKVNLMFGSNYKTELFGKEDSSKSPSFRFQLTFKRPSEHGELSAIPISDGLISALVVEIV